MLLSHGAAVDAPYSKGNDRTALEAAAENGHLDTVQILLNAGAGSKPQTRSQIATAKAFAKDKGYFPVITLLESYACISMSSSVAQKTINANSNFDNNDCETVIRTNYQDEIIEDINIDHSF